MTGRTGIQSIVSFRFPEEGLRPTADGQDRTTARLSFCPDSLFFQPSMSRIFNHVAKPYVFDKRLDRLATLVELVDRPGNYCCHGRLVAPMPKLEIGKTGQLSFPVPTAQIDSLIAEASQAPYGKGEETVIDTSVRNCWQIGSGEIRLGDSWKKILQDLVRRSADGLGLPRKAVKAELYKMLIYEKGGFFKPHRDTEKADGMVATLVAALPVSGSGGDLIVRHAGGETVIDLRTDEPSELAFAAFYADCEHEVLPVAAGHRVCLVYNLILKQGKPVSSPDFRSEESAIAMELKTISQQPDGPRRLIWVLEHDYSEAGLSFDTLKNIDATIGRVLLAAADRSNYDLHLALLNYEDSGIPEYSPDDCYDEAFDICEIFDSDCWLEGFVRPDGAKADYGKLDLVPDELMPPDRMRDEEADSSSVTEATGNEGASFERWYCRAAFVLWPNRESLKAFKGSAAEAILAMASFELNRATTPAQIEELASQLVSVWPDELRLDQQPSVQALSLLCKMDHKEAISQFFDQTVLPLYGTEHNPGIETAAGKLGAERMKIFLTDLTRTQLRWNPKGIVDLLTRLHQRFGNGSDSSWTNTLRSAAKVFCEVMPRVGNRSPDKQADDEIKKKLGNRKRYLREIDSLVADVLRAFFPLGWHYGLVEEIAKTTKFFLAHPDLVSPDRTIPQTLNGLWQEQKDDAKRSGAFDELWRRSAEFLLSRSETHPSSPKDWRLPTDGLNCNCAFCEELRTFCADPEAQSHRFTYAEEIRRHLSGEIQKSGVDIRGTTESKGRPYTLICHKTLRSHERRLKEYGEDIKHMRFLANVAEAVADSATTTESLEAAIARAGDSSGGR